VLTRLMKTGLWTKPANGWFKWASVRILAVFHWTTLATIRLTALAVGSAHATVRTTIRPAAFAKGLHRKTFPCHLLNLSMKQQSCWDKETF